MSSVGAPLLACIPWLLAVAVLFALAAMRVPSRSARLTLVALGGLSLATFLGRWFLVPFRFFHQNGHGPEQVSRAVMALSGTYGPGLHELFHGAITLCRDNPELAVAVVQSLLAALSPIAAWSIARTLGGRGLLPWALALAVALDPMLARLTRSESYLGTGNALIFLAMALALRAGVFLRHRASFFCLALAAGAVVAQTARLHPWLWAATATVPLGLFFARGAWRRRLHAAFSMALVIAVVTVVTSGRALWIATHSDLSSRFSRTLRWMFPSRMGVLLAIALPLLTVSFVRARNRRSAALVVLATLLTLALYAAADLPTATDLRPWIHGAYARLYLPVWVALVTWALRDLGSSPGSRHVVAFVGLASLLVPAGVRWRVERTIPTDAREQSFVLGWRNRLPPGASLIWLTEAGAAVLRLPIHPTEGPGALRLFPANPARLLRDPVDDLPPRYYYRSSLCATRDGAPACERFEETHRLSPVVTWVLPAIPSYFVPYVGSTVRVGLYRMER